MTIEVIRPGPQTSIQDLGRWGFQRYGVTIGGAMDIDAARVANLLVGNELRCAVLEMTMVGPTLRFSDDTLIALCGAEMSATFGEQALPGNRPVVVGRGMTVAFGTARSGCRAYLAAAGGIDVPDVLGSKSAYVRGGFQSLSGRYLTAGDRLSTGIQSSRSIDLFQRMHKWGSNRSSRSLPWFIPCRLAASDGVITLRALRGSEFEWLDSPSRELLFTGEFKVTPSADRMGYRLEGPTLNLSNREELLSEAVCAGTIQVPPGGAPIVLMADCATSGGYSKVAHVVSVDLPLLAQTPIGRTIRFCEITIEQAQSLYREREHELRRLGVAIDLKGRGLETE